MHVIQAGKIRLNEPSTLCDGSLARHCCFQPLESFSEVCYNHVYFGVAVRRVQTAVGHSRLEAAAASKGGDGRGVLTTQQAWVERPWSRGVVGTVKVIGLDLCFLQARHIDSLSTPSSGLLLLLCIVCDVEVPQLVYPAHHAAHVKTMSTRSPDAMASMRRCEARQSDSRLATADDDVTTTARLSHLLSLLDAITRSQSRTLCFFRYFFVRYLRYLQARQQATFGDCLQVTQIIAEVQAMQVNREYQYQQRVHRGAWHAAVAPLGELCLCDHRDLGLVLGDLDVVTQDTCKAAWHLLCQLHTQNTAAQAICIHTIWAVGIQQGMATDYVPRDCSTLRTVIRLIAGCVHACCKHMKA